MVQVEGKIIQRAERVVCSLWVDERRAWDLQVGSVPPSGGQRLAGKRAKVTGGWRKPQEHLSKGKGQSEGMCPAFLAPWGLPGILSNKRHVACQPADAAHE